MSIYLIWLIICGIALNAWIGWHVGKLIGYFFAMSVYAASYTKWKYRMGRVHGFKTSLLPPFMLIPSEFFRKWWFFIKNGSSVSASSKGGVWLGIGNWTVFPANATEERGRDT